MKVGTSQVDITPPVGAELSGFAARTQPSVGVLDPLYARALYLSERGRRLLWLHLDLIGVDRDLVSLFRAWARQQQDLAAHQVMISATHTHSGPATIDLLECGRRDREYIRLLYGKMVLAAEQAMAETVVCEVVCGAGRLDLAVDRRGKASVHTDPCVGVVGFRRLDGPFVATIVNHAMHAVALGASNRLISADVPGRVAAHLARMLPGEPVVLATNGACGNLNPPAEDVSAQVVDQWGARIAAEAARALQDLPAVAESSVLLSAATRVPVRWQQLSPAQIDERTRRALSLPEPLSAWGDKYRRVVAAWQQSMLRIAAGQQVPPDAVELLAVRLGPVVLLGVGAEVFSTFAEELRRSAAGPIYVVGYANGDMGYIPTRAAHAEGGYEVEVAHVFYQTPPLQPDALELLRDQAIDLLERVPAENRDGELIATKPVASRPRSNSI